MYLCAIFLLPFRLFTMISCIVFLIIFLNLICAGNINSNRETRFRRFLIVKVVRFLTRIILFASGFYSIPYKRRKIKDFDKSYPNYNVISEKLPKAEKAPIFVANHVTWIDPIYMLSTKYCPSALSYEGVAKTPFLGIIVRAL